MEKNNSTALALTILLGLLVQVLFSFADSCDTPGKTVVAFSKAYFKLDPAYADYLCSDISGNEDFVADSYVYGKSSEAAQRGFNAAYMKSALFDIRTQTIDQSENSAVIRIQAKRRSAINPVYFVIGKLFHLGKTHPVDETVELVRENGKWRVCGGAFGLANS